LMHLMINGAKRKVQFLAAPSGPPLD
jgi:hypothetical protein